MRKSMRNLNEPRGRKFLKIIMGAIFVGSVVPIACAPLLLSSCSTEKGTLKYQAIDPKTCIVSGTSSNFKATNLTIPSTVQINKITHKVTAIGQGAFRAADISGILTLPNTITNIDDAAFWGCTNLTRVSSLPTELERIGNDAFFGCENIGGELNIPNGVTQIGKTAFFNCKRLTSLVCGSGITTIKDGTFYGGYSLETANLGHATSIEKCAFQFCKKLRSWTTTGVLTGIGDAAFRECGNLNRITFGQWAGNFTTSGNQAFLKCNSNGTVSGVYAQSFVNIAQNIASLPPSWTAV